MLLAAAAAAQVTSPGTAPASGGEHWSYRPLVRPALPAVTDPDWCREPLDRFVAAAWTARGLAPSPAADRATWLRRVSLDLSGLPPTPAELAAFLADADADAEARVVDRLLASPAHAERMALWWLDLARYADSQGYEKDALRRHVWRWRDQVIAAFARDQPFDQFTVEQLAGDLLPAATVEQRVATAFARHTMTNTEGGTDDEEFRVAAVIDRVNTAMSVWMGSTVGCAQCHDHKYDPISQREYYGLFAFFDQTADRDQADESPTLAAPTAGQQRQLDALDAELAALLARPVGELTDAEVAARRQDLDARRAAIAVPLVPVLQELPADQRRTTRLLRRGSFLTPGEPVTAGVPACWPALPADAPPDRLAFARWLVAAANPLTARVQVNRVWEQLFGRGLVSTGEDFGRQGEPPTHGELLDWLACEFRDGGWSWRRLLRQIALSATYRQSAAADAAARERDPDNVWLARGASFRLAGEVLRDQALAVSGLLVQRVGGPSVMPSQPDGVWGQIYSGEAWRTSDGADGHRRSLYTLWRRTSPHPAMTTFDAPSREFCVVRRVRTNTPLQALVRWNDPQFTACAAALAAAVRTWPGDDDARLEQLFARCLVRSPQPAEVARLRVLLDDERQRADGDAAAREHTAWSRCASVLMHVDEFVARP